MRFAAVVILTLLLGAACSGSDGDGDSTPAGEIIRVTPSAEPEPGAAPTPVLEGEILNEMYLLETGDCFNEYEIEDEEDGSSLDLTTRVDCRRPHDAEVYAELEHPAGADIEYIGRRTLELWATQNCYAVFEEFAGIAFEYSALQIGVIPPAEDNWNFGPYRTVECYVYAPDGQLSGTMRASGV